MAADAAARPRPIAEPLLVWAQTRGRHDLPWQHPADAYRVWISEVMLQQTQVATVIAYFERFMARFPTLSQLAQSGLDEVLALWSGLGYYARARNLHAAAQICQERFEGMLPKTVSELTQLPGIGRSTAGAIAALAYHQRAAILDGNAKRVLARYHAIAGWPGSREVEKTLWRLAEQEMPQQQVAAYTQAIMDLGASVCTRSSPQCTRCPLSFGCAAHAMDRVMAFPAPRPKRERPLRHRSYAWIERNGAILFEQRAPQGVWGGLLCLPELPAGDCPAGWCRNILGLTPVAQRDMTGFRHEFTHFRLHAQVIALNTLGECASEAGRYRWLTAEDACKLGLPAPLRSYLTRHVKNTSIRNRETA